MANLFKMFEARVPVMVKKFFCMRPDVGDKVWGAIDFRTNFTGEVIERPKGGNDILYVIRGTIHSYDALNKPLSTENVEFHVPSHQVFFI